MHKILLGLLILFFSTTALSEESPDYLAERRALAASENYNPYGLMMQHKVLLDEHYRLGADPKTSVAEVNEPLQKLVELYPLGIQVNQALAGFLEYLVRQSDDAKDEDAKGLLEIAKKKEGKSRCHSCKHSFDRKRRVSKLGV